MNWKDLEQVKMGDIGEQIIHDFLEKKDYTIFTPTTLKSHPCDAIVFKNKELIFLYDVKTKGKTNYHNAQGIDKKHYNQYNKLMKKFNVPFYVFFIDDQNGEVHCADLEELSNQEYLNITKNGSIIGWNVNNLKYLFTIDKKERNKLKNYNTRNYDYTH